MDVQTINSGWINVYSASGIPGVVSTTGVELTGRRNKGTLLLSDGPNEAAVSGDVVEVLVIGRPA